jgi:hypothetical protein
MLGLAVVSTVCAHSPYVPLYFLWIRYCVLTKGLLVSYSSKQLALAEDGQYDGAAGAVDMTLAVVCAEMDISTCVPLSLVREFGFQMQQNSKGFMCYAEVRCVGCTSCCVRVAVRCMLLHPRYVASVRGGLCTLLSCWVLRMSYPMISKQRLLPVHTDLPVIHFSICCNVRGLRLQTLRAKQKWMRCLGEVSALHNPYVEAI